jgi:hypothetical protein
MPDLLLDTISIITVSNPLILSSYFLLSSKLIKACEDIIIKVGVPLLFGK